MEDNDAGSRSARHAEIRQRKLKKMPQMATNPQRQAHGGYEGSRFNAVRHGVLSELSVLPWEDETEYAKLLDALVEEYAPRAPTEDHLIEEIAGVIWRRWRLRLAEARSYCKEYRQGDRLSSKYFR